MSVMISGPLAAMMLADQGADVMKVESPGLGDIMRHLGTSKGGMTGIFLNNNRGKRSLVVDIKQAPRRCRCRHRRSASTATRSSVNWASMR